MTDRDAIIELTDEVERWQQKLLEERKAHDATRESLRLAGDLMRYADERTDQVQATLEFERDAYSRSLERAEAVLDFWEAEAERLRISWIMLDHVDCAEWHARRTTR